MRQAGTLPTRDDATRFADFLLTQGITARLLPETDGVSVWIREEKHVDRARELLEEYRANPTDARYRQAHAVASDLRKEEQRAIEQARRNLVLAKTLWSRPSLDRAPLTIALTLICIAVAVWSDFGAKYDTVLQPLWITELHETPGGYLTWNGLEQIRTGQVWRLFTPCLIHFGFLHPLFNLLWLNTLGRMIESIAGSGRYLALVLSIGVLSNLAQYFYPIDAQWLLHPFTYTPRVNPMFGGMSGVVYGLFGYVWMKMKFHRQAGYYLDPTSITLFLVWFAACTLGFVGNIANTAHAVGLLVGLAFGFASAKWATRR